MKTLKVVLMAAPLALAGCWTVSETEYPVVSATPAPTGREVRIKLVNYRTGLHSYVPVEGHESMSVESANNSTGKRYSWFMDATASGRLVTRTINELKARGYKIDRNNPDYVIDLKYDGPVLPDYDTTWQFCYLFGTLFTAENTEVTWSAKLKLLDGKTNKVLMENVYDQNYEVTVWGPIPVFSPGCSKKSTTLAANSWAITAITDRAIADVTAYINQH